VKGSDQFHVGIVVDDLEAALESLGTLFGYEWCAEFAIDMPVILPEGETTIAMRFRYSATVPRVEVIASVPGTVWVSAAGSGVHHLGYWSDDLDADAAALVGRGYREEARGVHPDGTPMWGYFGHPDGPRVELVSRDLKPGLEQYWAAPAPAPTTSGSDSRP
jgi:hypothetical protein